MDIKESGNNELSTTKHDDIFSLMKGIAIISVVVGHCSVTLVEDFVNQYHLATFYFIAGYFFKPIYLTNPKKFIVKKIKRLYLPFISYGLVFLLLHNVLCQCRMYPVDDTYTIIDFVHNGLKLILGLTSYEPFMGAMWFAPSLLMVSIAYIVTRKIWEKNKWGYLLCYIIGYTCIKCDVKNPYCIWNTMVIVIIYHLGSVWREQQLLQLFSKGGVIFTCIVLMVVIYNMGGIVRFQASEMSDNNPMLFFIVPLLGVSMVYGVSECISRTCLNKVISLCGEYSFEIMALHFICFKIVALPHIYFTDGSFSNLADFPVYKENLKWWTPVYTVVGCVMPILITLLCRTIKSKLIRR